MNMAPKRERILPRLIEEEMRESFLDYSMSVIVQRALPDVRDGLKPVHRRILYAMKELGLGPGRPYKKSATVVGDVLGKYHPHGGDAVYEALVRMVQDFSLRYPLVDGQGNFGSIDGDPAAAYRYTEARLAPPAMELLEDIDRDAVDWEPNFDDRLREPSVLPGRFPNLLVNGSSGIAVGMSTNVPPHNLGEVVAALRALIDDPDCTIDDLMRHVPGPDFPTGAFIVGEDSVREMYHGGRGRIVNRARFVRENLRRGKEQLVVTELPYATSKTKVIEQIAALARRGQLDEVSELRDESDRDGMRLVIELKKGADMQRLLPILHRRTNLQTTFGAILIALDEGQPRQFNLKEILERYRDHRLMVIRRRSEHELRMAETERHIAQGLLVALDRIDEVIAIVRTSENRERASVRLRERLELSEEQAEAILNMRLGKLTALERTGLKDRLRSLEAGIEKLRDLLKSEDLQLEVILDELDELVERYGDARRTVILGDAGGGEVAAKGVVADEDVVVTVSHAGYVKRTPTYLYRRRVTAGKELAEMERYRDDYWVQMFLARTGGWLLAFTERGRAHFLPVLNVPEGGSASRGRSVYGLLGVERRERIVSMLPVEDLSEEGRMLVFLSARGLMKRTLLSDFAHAPAAGMIAAGVRKDDRIVMVTLSDGTNEIVLLSKNGRAIRFPEEDISVMGRPARGVKGIDLAR